MENIVALWKPVGPTSHDLVDAVRRVTGERRVGHAGTLDPLAEGVLVIGIGRDATRQLGDIVQKEKEYIATVHLGATSTTDDAEGEKSDFKFEISNQPTEDTIRDALPHFIGTIQQVPPVYSALKVRGMPAHRRVRRGQEVTLEPRSVRIDAIELLEYTWPIVRLRVVTGPGVYIRSLARDLGQALGTGGYLDALVRTRVGQYAKQDARTREQFEEQWRKNAGA